MLIVPAIDIISGKCVRLTQGSYSKMKIYSANPLEVALGFQKQGAQILNIIDLDGAKQGSPQNFELITDIVRKLKIPVQVGGGIRTFEDVRRYLKAGVSRVILGTRVIKDTDFLKKVMEEFGSDKIVVSVDVKNGKVATNGWVEISDLDYLEFAKSVFDLGVKFILCTDVSCDGTQKNPDLRIFNEITDLGLNVFAAGGISDTGVLLQLNKNGVYGAVLGKALYENKLRLSDALAVGAFRVDSVKSFLTKRIIPCMDVMGGRVVKGVNFKGLIDAGDPVELGKKYSDEGADELIFLDISASKEKRKTVLDMVRKVAKNVFIPFTVGGGIETVSDIKNVLESGADKISINTVAVKNPSLISEASKIFGSQCIVVAIDVKKVSGKYKVFIKGGTEETSFEAVSWAKRAEELGAGEILLTSMDRDGTKNGFDNFILRQVSFAVNIPVIASGGVGDLSHLREGIEKGHADAVLAASIFHYGEYSIPEVKRYLKNSGIAVRLS